MTKRTAWTRSPVGDRRFEIMMAISQRKQRAGDIIHGYSKEAVLGMGTAWTRRLVIVETRRCRGLMCFTPISQRQPNRTRYPAKLL